MGHICNILNQIGRLFTTHSLTYHKVRVLTRVTNLKKSGFWVCLNTRRGSKRDRALFNDIPSHCWYIEPRNREKSLN